MAKQTFQGRPVLPGDIEGEAMVSKQPFNPTSSYIENLWGGATDSAICTDQDNKDLFENPKHPYTEALLASLPKPHPKYIADMKQLEGEVADPGNLPQGCYFHPRCSYKKEICQQEYPQFKECGANRKVSCHFADELSLKGI